MKSKKKEVESVREYDKQYKVISILLFMFSVLLLLALISYTHKDDENARIGIFDLFGLLTGDPIVEAKAATTQNWLGLFGAWISYILYNKTVGFALLPVPIFLIAWTRYIFSGNKVSDLLLKNTTVYFAMTILFSGLMGTLMTFETLADISREWSGSIGQFLASVFTGLLGSVGTVIMFIFGMLITLYLGTDIKFEAIYQKVKTWAISLKKSFYDYYNDKQDDTNEDSNVDNSSIKHEDSKTNSVDSTNEEPKESYQIELPIPEPARIINRKPNIVIKKVTHDENEIKENPFKPDLIANNEVKENISKIETSNQKETFDEIVVPAFKPNFKNVKDEAVSSMDIEERNQNLEFEKTLDNYQLENEDTNESSILEDEIIKPISIELPVRRRITDDENIIEPEIQERDENVVAGNVLPRSLSVTVQKLKPEPLKPVNLLGTNIHDEVIQYTYPGSDLLNCEKATSFVDEKELTMNAQILQEKLETFKIFIENLSVTPGPVVTQYEFVPAAGIKISRIESLSDDLAMALKAKGIRIIAPIPGKGTVGVEIPNANPAIVRFGETIESSKFKNSEFKLPLVLGKTISGEVHIVDLAKMPHLLIAGSTGSGKSVGINTIISSLIYKMHPSELKFVMIDPKKVELQSYSKLRNHFMAASPEVQDTIVTKPEDAVTILKAAVAEMELRYDILASVRQRNIADYNQKVKQGTFKEVKDMDHKPMPYIVVIIDELADLMLIASKEIEEPIARLAQMARAVGIHLVVATQRPSVDVITGVIKANFPARIAYLVTSKIDSRTILDMQGAEKLLGDGDMLCLPPGSSKPVRIQNSFVSTDEVERICDFIEEQEGYSEPYYLPSLAENNESSSFYDPNDRDPLFEDAARLIVRHQQGSVSLIQRRLKVGYARAGRIVDELEHAGVVGPFDGSKARLVLIESEADLERIL